MKDYYHIMSLCLFIIVSCISWIMNMNERKCIYSIYDIHKVTQHAQLQFVQKTCPFIYAHSLARVTSRHCLKTLGLSTTLLSPVEMVENTQQYVSWDQSQINAERTQSVHCFYSRAICVVGWVSRCFGIIAGGGSGACGVVGIICYGGVLTWRHTFIHLIKILSFGKTTYFMARGESTQCWNKSKVRLSSEPITQHNIHCIHKSIYYKKCLCSVYIWRIISFQFRYMFNSNVLKL